MDNLRNCLLPLIDQLFKIEISLNDHSHTDLVAIPCELQEKVRGTFQELKNRVNDIQKKDMSFVLQVSTPFLSRISP